MRSFISPGDPLFFSHHAYVDKVFSLWQDCHDYDIFDYSGPDDMNVKEEHYAPRACKENMRWGSSNKDVCEYKAEVIQRQRTENKIMGSKNRVKLQNGDRRFLGWM